MKSVSRQSDLVTPNGGVDRLTPSNPDSSRALIRRGSLDSLPTPAGHGRTQRPRAGSVDDAASRSAPEERTPGSATPSGRPTWAPCLPQGGGDPVWLAGVSQSRAGGGEVFKPDAAGLPPGLDLGSGRLTSVTGPDGGPVYPAGLLGGMPIVPTKARTQAIGQRVEELVTQASGDVLRIDKAAMEATGLSLDGHDVVDLPESLAGSLDRFRCIDIDVPLSRGPRFLFTLPRLQELRLRVGGIAIPAAPDAANVLEDHWAWGDVADWQRDTLSPTLQKVRLTQRSHAFPPLFRCPGLLHLEMVATSGLATFGRLEADLEQAAAAEHPLRSISLDYRPQLTGDAFRTGEAGPYKIPTALFRMPHLESVSLAHSFMVFEEIDKQEDSATYGPKLKHLALPGLPAARMPERLLEYLLPRLTHLDLSGSFGKAGDFSKLAKVIGQDERKELDTLVLKALVPPSRDSGTFEWTMRKSGIDWGALKYVLRARPKTLDLSGNRDLDLKALVKVLAHDGVRPGLNALEGLSLAGCGLSDWKPLLELSKDLSALRRLDMSRNQALPLKALGGAAGMSSVGPVGLWQLEQLVLQACQYTDWSGLPDLLRASPGLRRLDLSANPGIDLTPLAVAMASDPRLGERLSALQELNLDGCGLDRLPSRLAGVKVMPEALRAAALVPELTLAVDASFDDLHAAFPLTKASPPVSEIPETAEISESSETPETMRAKEEARAEKPAPPAQPKLSPPLKPEVPHRHSGMSQESKASTIIHDPVLREDYKVLRALDRQLQDLRSEPPAYFFAANSRDMALAWIAGATLLRQNVRPVELAMPRNLWQTGACIAPAAGEIAAEGVLTVLKAAVPPALAALPLVGTVLGMGMDAWNTKTLNQLNEGILRKLDIPHAAVGMYCDSLGRGMGQLYLAAIRMPDMKGKGAVTDDTDDTEFEGAGRLRRLYERAKGRNENEDRQVTTARLKSSQYVGEIVHAVVKDDADYRRILQDVMIANQSQTATPRLKALAALKWHAEKNYPGIDFDWDRIFVWGEYSGEEPAERVRLKAADARYQELRTAASLSPQQPDELVARAVKQATEVVVKQTLKQVEDGIKGAVSTLTKAKEETDGKVQPLQEQVKQVIEENSNIREDNEKVKADNLKLQTDNRQLQTDNKQLKEDNAKLKADNDELRKDFAAVQRTAEGNSKVLASLQKTLRALLGESTNLDSDGLVESTDEPGPVSNFVCEA